KSNLTAILDPNDHVRFEDIRAGFGRGSYPQMVDLTIRKMSDTVCERRILSVSFGSVLREDSGAILVSSRDVTSERATEADLTKTQELLERVCESSADAIISADLRGLILLFNRAAERVYGYPAKEVVLRMNVRDLYPSGYASQIMRLIHSKEYGGPGRLEGYRTEVLAKDGGGIPGLLSAALVLEQGRPVGYGGCLYARREPV